MGLGVLKISSNIVDIECYVIWKGRVPTPQLKFLQIPIEERRYQGKFTGGYGLGVKHLRFGVVALHPARASAAQV